MNVYEKLNEARLRFQNAGIKKSGKNTFAHYDYYELSDILPAVNAIAAELKFSCAVSFLNEPGREPCGVLEITDCEKPDDRIKFYTPMAKAELKGCHEVQNLGAAETYLKRYLYQNAFEITESDALDGTMNPAGSGASGGKAYIGDNDNGIMNAPPARRKAAAPADKEIPPEKLHAAVIARIRESARRLPPETRRLVEHDISFALSARGESLRMALDSILLKVEQTQSPPASAEPEIF